MWNVTYFSHNSHSNIRCLNHADIISSIPYKVLSCFKDLAINILLEYNTFQFQWFLPKLFIMGPKDAIQHCLNMTLFFFYFIVLHVLQDFTMKTIIYWSYTCSGNKCRCYNIKENSVPIEHVRLPVWFCRSFTMSAFWVGEHRQTTTDGHWQANSTNSCS